GHFTKKEQLMIDREITKMETLIGGIDRLDKLPSAIFVIDAKKEENAIKEAKKTGVTVVALADTNADPTVIDYPIPANDDAIKAIELLTTTIANAYEDGQQLWGKKQAEKEKTEASLETNGTK
ncbi:MAG TPA: 30S ribosomal protein S2, partial [Patescibacteria group bacterium]|nr:30S ribosomal protein S2 [Patescibacteria group bacterium]